MNIQGFAASATNSRSLRGICFAIVMIGPALGALGQKGIRARDTANESAVPPPRNSGRRNPLPFEISFVTEQPGQCKLFVKLARQGQNEKKIAELSLKKTAVVRLYAGSYSFETDCVGFEKYSAGFKVGRDNPTSIVVPLKSPTVSVVLKTNPGETDISSNGRSLGRTGADGMMVLQPLPIGKYELTVAKEDYVQKKLTLDITRDTKLVQIDLEREPRPDLVGPIEAAIDSNRLTSAFDLYEKSRLLIESAPRRGLLVKLVLKLHEYCLQVLSGISFTGLQIPSEQLVELKTLYQRAANVATLDAVELDRTFVVFRTFWDLKQIVNENPKSTTDGKDQTSVALREQLDRLELLQPANPYLLLDLGFIYQRLHNLDLAQRQFQFAAAARPDWTYPKFALARLHMDQAYTLRDNNGRTYKARLVAAAAEFESTINQDKDFTPAYALAAFCYADGGQPDQAVSVALRGFAVAAPSALVNYALGYAYFSSGRKHYEAARMHLEAALSATREPLDVSQRTRVQQILNLMSGKKN